MSLSSTTMENWAPVGQESQPSGCDKGGPYTPTSRTSAGVRASAIAQTLNIFNFSPSKNFYIVLTLATICFSVVSAQLGYSFSHPGNSYNCSSNCICLGNGTVDLGGSITIIPETPDAALNTQGIVYSNVPVQLFEPSTNMPLSFRTYFAVQIRKGTDRDNYPSERGDGITFVMSADNLTVGSNGAAFGIFNRTLNYTTNSKHLVVEFDTVMNSEWPINDIDDNHVSFDFTSISPVCNASAYPVGVALGSSFYAWVEYSNKTQLLEARVSNNNGRPSKPLLSCRVNLSDVVAESMWVGFAGGSGGLYSNYYIQEWTFTVGPLPPPGGRKWGMIAGISVSVLVFLLACSIIFFFVRRTRLRMHGSTGGYQNWHALESSRSGCPSWCKFTRQHLAIQLEGMPKRFSYRELSVACKNFGKESKLGEGGFGSVYRGVLPFSGIPVAVKKIKADSNQGEREFMAEVFIITQLRHRNLIHLLGWCEDASRKQYLLVYELMPNGSLDKVLFGPAEEQTASSTASLSWEKRFNIVTGTAVALDYLHEGCQKQVIHGDIKSSNIMLDEEWNAKLGDFGLARLVDHNLREANTTDSVAGTRGYLAPEVAISRKFSDKSDVFAFGATVLEATCGRRAWSPNLPPEEKELVKWVWDSLSKGDLMRTVDRRLEKYDSDKMEVMLKIGLLCSHPDPVCRPSMQYVGQILAGAVPVPPVPLFKPPLLLGSRRLDQTILSDCYSNDLEIGSNLESELTPLTSLVSNDSPHSTPGSSTRFPVDRAVDSGQQSDAAQTSSQGEWSTKNPVCIPSHRFSSTAPRQLKKHFFRRA